MTAKLEELKKLKVPELKSRLKELGLDSRGLKADLIGRLWSALDGGLESKLKNDTAKPHLTLPTEEEPVSPALPVRREFSDTATQTDTGLSGSADARLGSREETLLKRKGEEDLTVQEIAKGRAFYEFKEEIRYKRGESLFFKGTGHRVSMICSYLSLDELMRTCLVVVRALSQRPKMMLALGLSQHIPMSPIGGEVGSYHALPRAHTKTRQYIPIAPNKVKLETTKLFHGHAQRPDRSKLPPVAEEIVEDDKRAVNIDLYNSHLHFEVEPDGHSGHPRFWERFPLLWSGCRLTHGVQQNRVGFEVRLERILISQPQSHKDVELDTFGLRVGWSGAFTSLMLGNDFLSFAYDGRGKKVSQGKEDNYGQPLSVGDIIGCYASFSSDGAVELSFQKNGYFMGVAFSLDASALHGQPLFPHVVCRSCSVRFLLDPLSCPWYPSPPGFTSLITLPDAGICTVPAPRSKSQCEMILMVGFPGSGKTHWAKNHINQHPEKHYRLLNTDELLACMTTNVERDIKLQQASQCLTELIKLAAERPGNYILDQCNILFSARQYKLQLFISFRRKVMVIFPSKEEWKQRLSKHQIREKEQIPHAAFLKLQISCTLPEQDNLIDELQYVELSQQQAQTVLQEYKDEARRLLPPAPKHVKKPSRYNRNLYPHRPPLSYKTLCTDQNSWSNLQSWSQPQQFWPFTYVQEYYNNSSDLSSCSYQSYW